MIESLLLSTTRIQTFDGQIALTNATGFFFEQDERLFLVTSLHVVIDAASKHFPDRLVIELHIDRQNVAMSTGFSIPLYQDGKSVWRDARDSGGEIDVAVIEIDRNALPAETNYSAFTDTHLQCESDQPEVGTALLVVGFPLGFHDHLHHTPVVRQAIIASSFGLRFQGQGYFLTDARTHRGISGAPVVMRIVDEPASRSDLPWKLLGIHSGRMDLGTRDLILDEALGLNCAWFADILPTLTAD